MGVSIDTCSGGASSATSSSSSGSNGGTGVGEDTDTAVVLVAVDGVEGRLMDIVRARGEAGV